MEIPLWDGSKENRQIGFALTRKGSNITLHIKTQLIGISEGKYVALKFENGETIDLKYKGPLSHNIDLNLYLKLLKEKEISVIRFDGAGQTNDVFLSDDERKFMIENLNCLK